MFMDNFYSSPILSYNFNLASTGAVETLSSNRKGRVNKSPIFLRVLFLLASTLYFSKWPHLCLWQFLDQPLNCRFFLVKIVRLGCLRKAKMLRTTRVKLILLRPSVSQDKLMSRVAFRILSDIHNGALLVKFPRALRR